MRTVLKLLAWTTVSFAPAAPLLSAPAREIVTFGDSWSDAGTFGIVFGTSPGPAWPEILATSLGTSPTRPYLQFDPGKKTRTIVGGTNYAQGGSRISLSRTGKGDADEIPWPLTQQVDTFLKNHKHFDDGQLVVVWAGGNDVVAPFVNDEAPVTTRAFRTGVGLTPMLRKMADGVTIAAADAELHLIARLRAAGARRVIVLDLVDIGLVPFRPGMNAAGLKEATRLTRLYNDRLAAGLPKGADVLLVRISETMDRAAADPDAFGYANVLEDACNDGSFSCSAEHYTTVGAADGYMFAGWGHFTAKTRRLIAAEVATRVLDRWPALRAAQ